MARSPRSPSTEDIHGTMHEDDYTRDSEEGEAHHEGPSEEPTQADHDEGKDHTTPENNPPESNNDAPPLPDKELPPPLPNEPIPDDGWQPVWDETAQAFYFYNRFSGLTQWTNPRVPEATTAADAPSSSTAAAPPGTNDAEPPKKRPAGGYDPSIHGDYDPNAWYAQTQDEDSAADATASYDPSNPSQMPDYTATGHFNRFTGRWQAAEVNPENYSDEAKSRRQMGAFFDVDAAANSHDGRSLKAERAGKKLSKQELKQFKEKRKARKEEKRRAWLRD